MITLRLINEIEFDDYFHQAIKGYAKEKVASTNWTEEEALLKATNEFCQLLPNREKTENHYVYNIFNDNLKVGVIWLGLVSPSRKEDGYIYDFIIFDEFQGKGYGKKTMIEIDKKAKELGMNRIELHVFGHNKIARLLYEKIGYEITNIIMSKTI
ncbi:N-acetyltransferase [Bacillus sp. EAC]|uniref:GNAT family N-acetyltransferase n=1 Tax=Bacillus sp. EAC TaxID=1978338 RepID=UPI000B448AD0|nr:GNAT family N-acetyltransferase [Bacillus sp. EAC]